jgi:type IV secretory pathway VirB9-like protein
MRFRFTLFLTTALVPSLALADSHDPIPGKADPRIRSFPYNPANTMRLTTPGVNPVRIIFGEGEDPITVAGSLVVPPGDPKNPPTDWAARSAGRTLLLQPLHDNMAVSLLFVTTQKGDEQHNYVIELHVGTGDITTTPQPMRRWPTPTRRCRQPKPPKPVPGRSAPLRKARSGRR